MVELRPLGEADVEPVRELIARHFEAGSDYDVDTDDEAAGEFARVAERDGVIAGVMALRIVETRAALAEAMHMFDDATGVPAADRYGFVHMGYVDADHTGEGIGSRLLEELHRIGRERGVDTYVADAWFHGGPDSSEALLSGYGYEVVRRRSIAGHADGDCPKCGPDCVCEAALTVRRVDGAGGGAGEAAESAAGGD
jgi:GNAT superfamily N-acetyltransferase